MGYTTVFVGRVTFAGGKKLSGAQWLWLMAFTQSSHPKRDVEALTDEMDPLRVMLSLPVGAGGVNFLNTAPLLQLLNDGKMQEVVDHLAGHQRQSLWSPDEGPGITSWSADFPFGHMCQWQPTTDQYGIEWDMVEKFYDYTKWLQWLQDNIFSAWGLQLEGEVWYQGEYGDDMEATGRLYIDADGTVVKQPLAEMDNMLAAAANNDVAAAEQFPPDQVQLRDGLGRTPLIVAVWANAIDMVIWLLEHGGACLEAKLTDDQRLWWVRGLTTLHVLAGVEDRHKRWPDGIWQRIVALLPEPGPDVCIDALDDDGVTPLPKAAQHGHGPLVRWLCAHGADVNVNYQPLDEGYCALPPVMQAAAQGDRESLQALLQHGAKVDGTYILMDLADYDPSWIYAASDDSSKAERNKYRFSASKCSPLHVAAQLWRFADVELLVEHGADLTAKCMADQGYSGKKEPYTARELVPPEQQPAFDAAVHRALCRRRALVLMCFRRQHQPAAPAAKLDDAAGGHAACCAAAAAAADTGRLQQPACSAAMAQLPAGLSADDAGDKDEKHAVQDEGQDCLQSGAACASTAANSSDGSSLPKDVLVHIIELAGMPMS